MFLWMRACKVLNINNACMCVCVCVRLLALAKNVCKFVELAQAVHGISIYSLYTAYNCLYAIFLFRGI
jgi:hypothetical protein